jgi:hypothetical protein
MSQQELEQQEEKEEQKIKRPRKEKGPPKVPYTIFNQLVRNLLEKHSKKRGVKKIIMLPESLDELYHILNGDIYSYFRLSRILIENRVSKNKKKSYKLFMEDLEAAKKIRSLNSGTDRVFTLYKQ